MTHWKLTTRDETALLILGETVLADDRHYADFAEDIDDRGPLFKRLYDANAGDVVTLSPGELYQLKRTCLDVLKRLDHEDAARVDLAPVAYVLHKSYYLLDIPVPQDGRHLFYASLAKESFRESTLVLCAARGGFTLRLQHEVKRLLAHGAVLEACCISRRTAGNLRRAVDVARLHAIPDQNDESWFMTRDNLEDLKRLLCNLKERAASDNRFAPYRTTELDDITREVVRH